MKSFTKYILIAVVMTAVVSNTAMAKIRVSARVESSEDIYQGESFSYYIVLEGAESPGQVDLEPLQEFDPRSTGNREHSTMNFVNGKTTKNITTIMTYSLTADQVGRVRIQSVTVTVGGEKYKTNAVEVDIIKPGSTDNLSVEVSVSQQKCYVGQPVILDVELRILTRVKNAVFNVPVFSSGDFYIEDLQDTDKAWAQTDHVINGVPVLLREQRKQYKGAEAAIISFSKVLIPKEPGRIEISPVSVSADVAVGRSSSRDSFFGPQFEYKRFVTTSKPVALDVLPLPQQGSPADFYGLVGRYTISASATPTSVNVGDPITLTIKIGGNKYLKPVRWPDLEKVPALAANFKVPSQKSSPVIEQGFKVFTQTIRAGNDKVTEIPPIELSFFEPEKGQYVTVESDVIKLEVAPTKILTGADLEGMDFRVLNKEVEAIKKGLSANYEGFDVLENMGFSVFSAAVSPGYLLLWAGPLVFLLASCVIKLSTHTTPEKTAARRRRQAGSKAIVQLKKISSADIKQRPELVASAMKHYIGERFDKSAGSLTADDCYEIIVSVIQDTEAADEYKKVIADCEVVRYASAQANIELEKIREVIELIRSIEKKLRK